MGIYCFKISNHGVQHISRANARMKHLTAETIFSSATRGSQESTCNIPLQAAYKCAATVSVSPYSLVIGTQSGCTVWCTSDSESGYQWAWDCLLTPSIVSVTPAANLSGTCNSQLRP